MPSVKSQKSSTTYVQHPPTNRAFALRMMNSAQNTEVKMSPLDRALKPFKEGFKKSNKTKRGKGRGSQNPPACSQFSNEGRQDEVLYATFGPENESQHRHDGIYGSNSLKDHHQDKLMYSATNPGNQCNNRLHGAHMIMEDISEEEEFANYDKDDNYFGYDERKRLDRHSATKSDKSLAAVDLQDHQFLDGNLNETKYSSVGDPAESSDNKMYFVAPNGDIVRLRGKKSNETVENEGRSRSSALRTEKFGKRLSLLCHMLAEKYPEDFHILELLVELQVSNEKREEEMNKAVALLKEKVGSMEKRLAAVEQQSFSGFRQMLLPLAAAAEAFSVGMRDSLSTANEHNEIKSNDADASHLPVRRESGEDTDSSLISGVIEKEDIAHDIAGQDPSQQTEELKEYSDQIESPKEAANDFTTMENQNNDDTGIMHANPNEKKPDDSCLECDEKICIQEDKESSPTISNSVNAIVPYNDQESFTTSTQVAGNGSDERADLTSMGIKYDSDQESDMNENVLAENSNINNEESDHNSLIENEGRTFLASETSV